MAEYTVRASNSMGTVGGLSAYPVAEALREALAYRDEGFSNIQLTDVVTGVSVELDRFMRSNGNA